MKKIFTLAAASALVATALGSQAQIAVDGQLTAAEVSATGYSLVGRDTGTRGFAPSATNDAGLIALYAGADATNLYFFLVATLQNDGMPATISNSLQLLIARPGTAGVTVGTALPKPAAATAPGVNTSFQNFATFLELPGDIGIGIKGNGQAAQVQVDGVVYTGGATAAATAAVLSGAIGVAATGVVFPVVGQMGALTVFNGAQVAYRTSVNLNSNPGFGTAGAGAVPANGLEIAVSRASLGLPATGGAVQFFVLHNNQDGGFLSSDFIPQNNAALPASFTNAPNLGTNPDFRLVPGTQAATINVTATGATVALATRGEVAKSLRFGAYPNPGSAVSVAYTVPQGKQAVELSVFDAIGKQVRSLSESQSGAQSYKLSGLRAGIYVVKLNVGGDLTSAKVVIE